MSDLDKLMKRLKPETPNVEVPQETQGLKETPAPVEDQEAVEDELDKMDEEVVEETPAQKPIETPKQEDLSVKTPAQKPDENINHEHTIDAEVGMLQNDGIFRRELVMTLKELVDVQKVTAQVLIDIKKAVTGEKDAK